MKKVMFFSVLLFSVFFLMPTAHAGPDVTVINGPDAPIPVQGDVEVTNKVNTDANITNTADNPVPVTVTNLQTSNATIQGIARQQGEVPGPTVGTKYDLVSLSGPGKFISASVTTASHPSGVGKVDIELVIDSNVIFSGRIEHLQQIYKDANPFGIVATTNVTAGRAAASMGFPLPVSFENSVVLSATAVELNALTGTVIYAQEQILD